MEWCQPERQRSQPGEKPHSEVAALIRGFFGHSRRLLTSHRCRGGAAGVCELLGARQATNVRVRGEPYVGDEQQHAKYEDLAELRCSSQQSSFPPLWANGGEEICLIIEDFTHIIGVTMPLGRERRLSRLSHLTFWAATCECATAFGLSSSTFPALHMYLFTVKARW